jgi:hypothetical protein
MSMSAEEDKIKKRSLGAPLLTEVASTLPPKKNNESVSLSVSVSSQLGPASPQSTKQGK